MLLNTERIKQMKEYKVYFFLFCVNFGFNVQILLAYFPFYFDKKKPKDQEIQVKLPIYIPYLQTMIIPGKSHLQFDRVINYKG